MRVIKICVSAFCKEEANFDACRLPTLVHVAYSLLDCVQMVVVVPPYVCRVPTNSYFDPIINQLMLHI